MVEKNEKEVQVDVNPAALGRNHSKVRAQSPRWCRCMDGGSRQMPGSGQTDRLKEQVMAPES